MRLERPGVPGQHQAHVRGEAADPVELQRLVLDAGDVEQRLHREPAREHAERGAVLRRLVEDEVRRPQAAGAGHVLHDDVGIAGQVLAEMAREVARIDVVGRARRIADHHRDLLRVGGVQARADAIRAITAVAFFMANPVGRPRQLILLLPKILNVLGEAPGLRAFVAAATPPRARRLLAERRVAGRVACNSLFRHRCRKPAAAAWNARRCTP